MKRILAIVWIIIIMLSFCSCQDTESDASNNDSGNKITTSANLKEKNYLLTEIPYTNEIEKIDYVIIDCYGRKTIFADNKLYVYSEKKFLNETHWKSLDFDLKGYKFVGIDVNEILFMSKENIAIYNTNISSIDVSDKKSFYRDYTDEIWENYNDNIFYNFGIKRIYDKYILLNKDTRIDIPTDEIIINNYIINTRIFTHEELYIHDLFYSDKGNFYYVGHDETCKSNEYADFECDGKLIKIKEFDDILNDYHDNINYFDGHFLITKENKMYEVSYNTR